MAREFSRSEISKVAPVSGEPPKGDDYQELLAGKFVDWRLEVDGLVARPMSFSLADLQRLPSRTQITEQICEEGWSFVSEWTGVPLSHMMNLVGVLPRAKFVVVFPFDESWDSLDMQDALHPQTLIAYGMNGQVLPTKHGAPVRLKVPRQLGYKSVKYLARITITDTLKNIGTRTRLGVARRGILLVRGNLTAPLLPHKVIFSLPFQHPGHLALFVQYGVFLKRDHEFLPAPFRHRRAWPAARLKTNCRQPAAHRRGPGTPCCKSHKPISGPAAWP